MDSIEIRMFFLCQILDEISEQGIRIYQLPDADSDEDEEFKEQTRVLKVRGYVWVYYYASCVDGG